MTTQLRETYLKVGRITSLCVITAIALGAMLIATIKYRPAFLSRDTTESFKILIGLFFFLGWVATIGCYATVFNKSRASTWVLFGLFPPFALYAMFILIVRGSSPKLPKLGVTTIGLFALRAAVGWD